MPVDFSFSSHLQDTRPERVERRFGRVAEQPIPMTGQRRRDLRPISRRQGVEGSRIEVTIFHHNVTPLVLYEIANDTIHVLPQDLTIREDTVDRLSDTAQTLGPFPVLEREVTDLRCRSGIANFQLGKDQIFLGMVVHLGIEFKIANNRPNNLIVGVAPAIENLQFALEDSEQALNIAMLSA
jgi:hypothetical protein